MALEGQITIGFTPYPQLPLAGLGVQAATGQRSLILVGDGVRVSTRRELKAALEKAVATRGRFQLIDITIPRGVLSSTLQRFVAGVKRISAVK